MPRSSAEPLEQVVEGDPRKQLRLPVPQYEPGEWKYEFKNVVVHYDNTEFALRRSGATGQDSTFSDVHWTCIGWFERRQAVS